MLHISVAWLLGWLVLSPGHPVAQDSPAPRELDASHPGALP